MVSSVSMHSRWDFLGSWLPKLTMEYKAFEADVDPRGPPQRVLKVFLPRRQYFPISTYETNFREVFEALALLAAVERVDYASWRYCLMDLCGLYLGEEGEETFEEKIPVRFLIDLDLEQDEKGNFDLVKMCGTHQLLHPSVKYMGALKKIAAMDKKMKKAKRGVEIQIPVGLCVSVQSESQLNGLKDVAKAEKIIKQQWESYCSEKGGDEVKPGSFRCTFKLEPMISDFSGFQITDELAQTIGKLMDDNVWFSRIKLDFALIRAIAFDENSARKTLGTLIPRLFDNTRRSSELANISYRFNSHLHSQEARPLQIGAVSLTCNSSVAGVRDFERMCSALMVCQTTRKLSLRLAISPTAHQTSKTWWKWIAYSLFSKRARVCSSVESVTLILDEKIHVAEVEAFSDLLTSKHPEENLCSSPRGKVSERNATLKAGARIQWQITKQGKPRMISKALSFPSSIPFLRTFSDDGTSEWVNVITPGLSWCQVRRACLVFNECESGNATPCDLTSLTIRFEKYYASNSDCLQRLLLAVGTSLRYLMIDGPSMVVNENQILECCPNLCKLSVPGKWFDIQLDFCYYRANREPIPQIKCSGLGVSQLANALGDPSNPLSKCAYKVRVHQHGGWVRNSDRCLKALLRMLDGNESLEFLELDGSPGFPNFNDFRKHHLKPIARMHNLSKESKLAFLSVLSPRRAPGPTRKRANGAAKTKGITRDMDQYVLSKIFNFAGPPVLRKVFYRINRSNLSRQDADIYGSEGSNGDDWESGLIWFQRRRRWAFGLGGEWESEDDWDSDDLEDYL